MIEERKTDYFEKKEIEEKKINEFIKHFNEEAEKQKSDIRVSIIYNCPHFIAIFPKFLKVFRTTLSQIYCDVNNDEFSIVDDEEDLKMFNKYKDDIIPILEKIPEKFVIEK